MALGASKRDVLRLVVGRAMVSVLAGLATGLAGAFFFARFLAGLLFGVSTTDPTTFAGVCAILSLVALLASYLPARRAVALDPMTTLRYE
jgi:ABC-type antimicrobial peptide transport system permease subunit